MHIVKRIVVAILTFEARLVLFRYRPTIVAVTGSVGKTSTKDAIYTVLADAHHVRKSEKSFNSELGVPLTVLGRENAWHNPLKWIANIIDGLLLALIKTEYPKLLVLEVGADRPGDISSLGRWLKPNISVITAIPELPVHVEFFADAEEVAREKRALAESLVPGGVLVVNGDDERTKGIPNERGAVVTYGFSDGCMVHGELEEIVYEAGLPVGTRLRIGYGGASEPMELVGALGRTQVYPLLAALAVAYALTIDPGTAARKLSGHVAPPGRMRILKGIHGSTIVDDTYNASPAAVLAALDTMANVKAQRKIVAIADMLELGKYSVDAHRQVGQRARDVADIVIAVGIRAKGIAEAAIAAGMPASAVFVYEKEQVLQAASDMKAMAAPGDVILIKGSQSMRMEKVVKELMAEPDRAKELLVRQEAEWIAKA